MKKAAGISALLFLACFATDAWAAKYYYVSIGCWPDYKLHRVKCEVGTTWQACGREFCYGLTTAPTGPERQRAMADPGKAPRLLGPLPQGAPR